VKMFNTLNLSI